MELKFYPDYVHSRCLRECETKDVLERCGCRDAYMPGYSHSQSTVFHAPLTKTETVTKTLDFGYLLSSFSFL